MEKQSLVLGLVLIAGCASVTPHYDARFGDAVRQAKANMTINPEAGKNPDPVAGMDGKAARDAVILYQKSFQSPPPAVNVINIGGSIGAGR
ncbi:hypothetical protein [Noviherbaspirillum sp.]|uniref:hypothetical protein n=1 Tax=Noviherbaspirillum sp. TaxID=1926288 RepID=UPI002FE3BA8E